MQGEGIIRVGNGTDDIEVCLLIKHIIADNQGGPVSSLFVSRLRIEIDFDDVSLFYHTSLPTGSPQSTSCVS